MSNDESPKWQQLDPNSAIYKAQAARAAKAELREGMSDREQELLWGKEKFTEVMEALKTGKRRTILGFLQNTTEITFEEKVRLCDRLQETVNFLRDSIPSGQAPSRQAAGLLDPFA